VRVTGVVNLLEKSHKSKYLCRVLQFMLESDIKDEIFVNECMPHSSTRKFAAMNIG
jgi:hypothetical protein